MEGTSEAALTTSVNGPGQKRCASTSARGVQSADNARAAPMSATCTMTGFVDGRPLAVKMAATAFAFSAFAPSP